jgi:hypothetical protein
VVASASVTAAIPIAWLGALPTLWIALVARGMAAMPAADLSWPGGLTADTAVVIAGVLLSAPRLRRLATNDASALRAILGRWPP